jgi:putative SbcD/Mre11-related phosphoesterase
MTIKFLTDYPAAFVTEKKILVISDLHIGLETELLRSGIKIHKQIERFKETLDKLLEMTHPKLLVVLGDVKHKVPGSYMQELRDIPKFFQYMLTRVKVIVTAGNHDDYLNMLLPAEVKLYSSRGFRIGEYGFFHGHARPSKNLMRCDYLFIGHLQPSIEFRDKFGYRLIEQAWIKGKLDKQKIRKYYKISKTGELNIIAVPSFNRMTGGMAVNTKLDGEMLGPLLPNKIFDLGKSTAYLLDGTKLGLVKDLS